MAVGRMCVVRLWRGEWLPCRLPSACANPTQKTPPKKKLQGWHSLCGPRSSPRHTPFSLILIESFVYSLLQSIYALENASHTSAVAVSERRAFSARVAREAYSSAKPTNTTIEGSGLRDLACQLRKRQRTAAIKRREKYPQTRKWSAELSRQNEHHAIAISLGGHRSSSV